MACLRSPTLWVLAVSTCLTTSAREAAAGESSPTFKIALSGRLLDSLSTNAATLEELSPGAAVRALESDGERLRVVTPSGAVGWISTFILADSGQLRVRKAAQLHRSISKDEYRAPRDPMGPLAVGTPLTRLGVDRRAAAVKVRTAEGKTGYVHPWAVEPAAPLALPEYAAPVPEYLDRAQLDALVREAERSALEARFGAPAVASPKSAARPWARWTHVVTVDEGRRYSGFEVEFASGEARAKAAKLLGEGDWSLVDRLPLAAQVRALELAPLEWLDAQLRRAISPNGGSEWFRGGVLLAFFVGLTVLTFFVLTLPSMALLKVRPLSNGVVILASVLLIGALAYGWYLLVVLQLLQDTQWLSMVVMATLGVAALKLIEDQVSENRCPYCHVMDQVETVEHEHGPSQHRTEQRTRDVHVGRDVKEYERTRLDGERVKVRETTDHYERRAYDQKVTDRSFTIHRACRACQRGWAIHGKTTVLGHV